MRRLVFFILSLVLFFSINIESHEFNPAHLVIDQKSANESVYEVSWMYPFKNIGQRAEIVFPESCSRASKDPYIQGRYLVEKISLDCSSSLKGNSIEVINLSVLTDALVTIHFDNNETFEGLMNLQNSSIYIPITSQAYPTAYLTLGFNHLLNGADHILFILGLLFLITGFINVIKTITAFTIAHSITLGLSVLGFISFSQQAIEVLIALTIIYLAIEIIESKKYSKTPWLMAFVFGLLHGLGFAGALSDIGISNDQILLSLAFFNIGIEFGQILLIPIPLFLIYFFEKKHYLDEVRLFASVCIGGMGFYWFIDRLIGIIQYSP
tara:strand:+ start:949 stop:1920 length:972 start_codon:yes stop_codon:yes gene_type:complete